MKTKLPDKLSELILVALGDLEDCEKDPKYEIEMGAWHLPRRTICEVCLAGSVMAKTLKVPLRKNTRPDLFPREIAHKLQALEEIRKGCFGDAFSLLTGRFQPESLPAVYCSYYFESFEMDYHTNPEEWKLHMQTIVGILEAEGL